MDYPQGSYPSMGQANIAQEPSSSAQLEQPKEHPPFEFNMVMIEEETTNSTVEQISTMEQFIITLLEANMEQSISTPQANSGTIHHYPTSEEDLNRRNDLQNLAVFVESANYTMQ